MIREATESDFDSIVELSREFWKSTIFSEPFCQDQCRLMVEYAFHCGLLAVLEIDSTVVGFCAGCKSPLLASKHAEIGTELAWWVNPDHRGGRNGIKLMMFMEDLAKKARLKYWVMVSMDSSMDVGPIYERLGYKKAETTYIKVM